MYLPVRTYNVYVYSYMDKPVSDKSYTFALPAEEMTITR